MGIVTFGIPKKETEWLRKSMKLDVVVEGGTYRGETALLLSDSFKTVYTIEKSDAMFDIARKTIGNIENIVQLKGDTRDHLSSIVSENDNILFWLDAHWSGGQTYGQVDECPLIEELNIIFLSELKNFAILVDDARLFLAPPPLPHNHLVWPSLKEICAAIPAGFDLIILNDVIYIIPSRVKARDYMQKITTTNWSKGENSLPQSVKNCIRLFLNTIFKFAGLTK